ncbi:MAG: primosomal protein N' [Eubacteriales bacterium]|nr:primosomal protein N' [Eubacteriales bacterium]
MRKEFAKIIVDISHEKVDRPFEYRIPPGLRELVEPGVRVRIPFGAGNTLRTGYVIEVSDEAEFAPERLKQIDSVVGGTVEPAQRLIMLAAWMKEQYGSTMIQALKTVLPSPKKVAARKQRRVELAVSAQEAQERAAFFEKKHQTAKLRLLSSLLEEGTLSWERVTKQLKIPAATLKALEEDGTIQKSASLLYRNPIRQLSEREALRKTELSPDQQRIVRDTLAAFDRGDKTPALIHGITGSGKTEVYLALIEGMIERGYQAVMLIPEIALTYQNVQRFTARFGDRVSVINSSLSAGEKQDQRLRAQRGEIDVIIGPRSALFVPFPRLGMILIDEEHEASYKSETSPKYHARETAVQLAGLSGAVVVLGSATPSLEAYSRAKSGEYRLFTLKERLTGGQLPTAQIVDLREELHSGNRSIFSRSLQEKLRERLERREQSMLFLNRRGYAGFVSCRSCGYVCKCPHCDVSLSEHRGGRLVCHYCGYEQPAVTLCPSCGSKYILGFKAGTEQIEEQLGKLFPGARVLRMDADTTRTRDSYERILSSFSRGEADILVGTQMIVKGHDFPAVTLVGVLAADLSLSMSDYRAGERTFQLLTQAAGRAGRGSRPGQVVIQTYQPEHYSVRYAAAQDYEGFFQEEMLYRELLSYPPASHILAVQFFAKKQEEARDAAREAADFARRWAREREKAREEAGNAQREVGHAQREAGPARPPDTVVIGPAPALIGKINDVYRYGVYIKDRDYQRLVEVKDGIERLRSAKERPGGLCQFDFDPVHIF